MQQAILIVDDRRENLLALEKTLADVDAEVVKASTGERALETTLDREIALAILDVQMPGMDGYELAELLRGDPGSKHIPIIFLTAAFAEEAQIFKGYESGAVDYIVKPYNPVILVSKVRAFLELDRYQRELQAHRDRLDELVKHRTAQLEKANADLVDEINERIRTEAQLEEAVAALKRSNRDLEQFAYVASHDLQEPLRMVASYTELLAKRYEGQLDERADKYIAYAVDGAKRMQRLINDLLTFSRVGTRARPLEPTDCAEVAREVLHGIQRIVEESGARVTVGELPTVMADRTQLGQVLQNLLTNAVKFRGEQPPDVKLSSRRLGNQWEISVEDNGIGIDPQFHDRVFVIFQRLHERGKYPGTGIGLSVVKKVVERHGGTIRVDSAAGKGTRISFTVPAVDDMSNNDV